MTMSVRRRADVARLIERLAVTTVLQAILLSACTRPADEHLWQASMRGQVDDMERFFRQGADPNYVRGGHSILMRLARGGRSDIATILIASGANVNFKGKDGASALTVAAEHGNIGVARVLLANGADVDIRNDHGNTALMYAAEFGHPEMARLLLAARADVTPRDRDGETALMTARRRGHVTIARLLEEAGALE
jgi:ankyrin repeat protein